MIEPLRILMLEDNPADAELIQFELAEAGLLFTAKVVTTKNEFVRELLEFSPDIILSDYDLPQYNGSLALAEAKRRRPDIPFILVSGAIVEDRAIEILTRGAQDYVLKTRLSQRLVPAVQRAHAEAEEHKARNRAETELFEAHKNLEKQVAERTAQLQKEIQHRTQTEKSLLKYNERLELLTYVSSQLLASDRPQLLVEELCGRVMEYLDCQVFFNFLVDEQKSRLHLNAWAGIPREKAQEIEWLDFGVAVCGCAAKAGNRIVAENIETTHDIRTELVKSFGIKAYACHPLLEQKRVIGTLSFGTSTSNTFSEDELAMMKAVADQVAIAMSRVRSAEALRNSEERYRHLVLHAPAGIYEIDFATGRFTSVNDAMCQILGYTRDELLSMTAFDIIDQEGITSFATRVQRAQAGERLDDVVEYRIRAKDSRLIWASLNIAFRWEGGKIAGAMVVAYDVSERKQREKEQEKFNRTLRAMNNSNQAMMRATDENAYMQDVCKIIIDDCGHKMVWMGFAEEDEKKTVRPVISCGFEEGYLDTLKVTWADTERGQGPTGTAIRTSKPVICKNMLTDPKFQPWRNEALKRGYASSIALPFRANGKVFGALTIYSKEPDAFTRDEVQLLDELAGDLSYGIMALRWRAACAEAESQKDVALAELRASEKKYKLLLEEHTPAAIHEDKSQ